MKINPDTAEWLAYFLHLEQAKRRFTEDHRFDDDLIAFYDEIKAIADAFDDLARNKPGSVTFTVG